MITFEELAAARRDWIDTVLRPWCRTAARRELLKADQEWNDIAGRVDSEATLWTWAWSRFPDLVHDGLSGVNETLPVEVTLADGKRISGYPDGQRSKQGRLYLVPDSDSANHPELEGPWSIDEITAVTRVSDGLS